ncbi:MAG TPA: DoxX family protein [Terriglobales bacterium]|nr:DoxX family protein [Terriglobales bacterium]
MHDHAAAKTLAAVRIATGVFFLFFGEYKIADSVFARTTFPQQWLQEFISQDAVSFYAVFLQKLVLPHHVFFGYAVGIVELLIGLSLVLGLCVRPVSLVGALYMINLTLATWWGPGHNVPAWRYLGAELDHLPLLFLFLIFFSANAGRSWGLDGMLHRRQRRQTDFLARPK